MSNLISNSTLITLYENSHRDDMPTHKLLSRVELYSSFDEFHASYPFIDKCHLIECDSHDTSVSMLRAYIRVNDTLIITAYIRQD